MTGLGNHSSIRASGKQFTGNHSRIMLPTAKGNGEEQMARKTVDTLIIDLDNTIFDWFAVWYASFKPVYDGIIARAEMSHAEVEAAIRAVHQARRTSEYTFLLEELEILKALRDGGDIRSIFKAEIEASCAGRDHNLKLYPSVFRSLWDIKKAGTKIVAYTESMCFYSAYRLKRFGLDGVIDVLFSPEDHDTPAGVSLDRMRRLPDDFYELHVTEIMHTPPGELKPNPRVLLDIIGSVGGKTERCAYVGDSLFKDVAMARDVGVFDVHAQYGESQRRSEYSLLQRVSHWTEEDVQREKEIVSKGHDFVPSAVLKDAFAEIFIYCEFVGFPNGKREIGLEQEHKNVIEVWKTCVTVQQHFNDLEMRIRNFAISVVGALIAAVSFTYQQGLHTDLFGKTIPTGSGLLIAALFAWGGFFLMDRYWYHILLKGAVMHAGKIEDRYKDEIPDIGLGKTISSESGSVKFCGFAMNSDRRLTAFYILGFLVLIFLFAVLLYAEPARKPVTAQVWQTAVPGPAASNFPLMSILGPSAKGNEGDFALSNENADPTTARTIRPRLDLAARSRRIAQRHQKEHAGLRADSTAVHARAR